MRRNIFNLALDFYQSPAEHRDLLDPAAPLPQDVSFLLDALTENKDPGSEQSKELPADLRAAIQFLIERVFFTPGADCYRILGLNIGAKTEEIRKHYNQLLHIFALDQADRSGEWNTAFATQINRAYSVLRDPERRLAYDQGLLQPVGGKGPGSHAREGKAAGDAEPAKSPAKVSYLNPGAPPARSLTPEQEIQELQRQLLKGTRDSADNAIPSERPAPAQEPSPRSSFIANRIDRANGITESPAAGMNHQTEAGEDAPSTLQPEPVVGSQEHFPRGIPVTAPDPDAHKGKRIFSMDRASFALIVAVVLVLVVYAIVLPNRFQGGPGSESELAAESVGGSSFEQANGNIVREESRLPDSGVTVNPFAPAHDAGVSDAGNDTGTASVQDRTAGLPASTAASAGQAAGTGSASVPAIAPMKPQTDARQLAAIPPAESGHVSGAPGEGKKSTKSPAKTEATTPSRPDKVAASAPAARKDAAVSASGSAQGKAGAEAVSPSKKLESMRQTTQPESAIASSSLASTVQDTAKTTASANPPQKKAVQKPAMAAPSRQVQPSAGKPADAGSGTVASIIPAQPTQNGAGITIQELDRLGETFSRAYEAGDLALLVSLFSEDARTNDQSSRAGIEQDYQDLFQLSERRTFTFGRLRWEQGKNGDGLKGEGDFQAEVRLKGENSVTTVQGKVVFHVKRTPGGVVITEMLHSYN